MNLRSCNYMLTNEKSGNSCIFIDAAPLWTGREELLSGIFEKLEREQGVSEIEIKFKILRYDETFKEIRLRRILFNMFLDNDPIDLVYLSKERN